MHHASSVYFVRFWLSFYSAPVHTTGSTEFNKFDKLTNLLDQYIVMLNFDIVGTIAPYF